MTDASTNQPEVLGPAPLAPHKGHHVIVTTARWFLHLFGKHPELANRLQTTALISCFVLLALMLFVATGGMRGILKHFVTDIEDAMWWVVAACYWLGAFYLNLQLLSVGVRTPADVWGIAKDQFSSMLPAILGLFIVLLPPAVRYFGGSIQMHDQEITVNNWFTVITWTDFVWGFILSFRIALRSASIREQLGFGAV